MGGGSAGDAGALPHGLSSKLAEIHAAETRLSAPPEVLRRRVTRQMPPGEGAGRRAGGATWAGALGAAVGAAPRTSLGRGRWVLPADTPQLPPLAEEHAAAAARNAVAQRALAAGTRALLYGSALAVVASVVGARAAAHAYDIRSEADLRATVAAAVAPRAAALKAQLGPGKEWVAGCVGAWGAPGAGSSEGGAGEGDAAAFAAQLRRSGAFRGLVGASYAAERSQQQDG